MHWVVYHPELNINALQITKFMQTVCLCILREKLWGGLYKNERKVERWQFITLVVPSSSNCCLLNVSWSSSGFFLLPVLEDACPPRTILHKGSTLVKPGEISFMKMGNDLWHKSTFQILVQTMGIILCYLAWQQSLACLASKPPSVREIFRHRKKSWWQRPCHHDIKQL